MNTSPVARMVRTFLAALAGYAASWAALTWTDDPVSSGKVVALNVATAAVAGLAAFFLARSGVVTTTPITKAVATFCQILGSGLAVLAFNSAADYAQNGRIVVTTLIAAGFAALATFSANAAEAIPPGPVAAGPTT